VHGGLRPTYYPKTPLQTKKVDEEKRQKKEEKVEMKEE